jgi:hypothetical protein
VPEQPRLGAWRNTVRAERQARNLTPICLSRSHAIVHWRRMALLNLDSNSVNSGGAVKSPLSFSRAPPAEMSSNVHGPITDPSGRTIMAGWLTRLRGDFRSSAPIGQTPHRVSVEFC